MIDSMKNILRIKNSAKKRIVKFINRIRGDVFDNAGAVTSADLNELRRAIDQVAPQLVIEIGTGTGVSTRGIFTYLIEKYPECEFFTIDIFQEYLDRVVAEFSTSNRFHVRHGLSVNREETTNPAFDELANYNGPVNVLRKLLQLELKNKFIDVAFIDSRKGTAVPEFKVIAERLSPNGIILCHDILNGGKAVELVEYLKTNSGFTYEIIDTGPAGMVRIQRS
jgi:predicted O-methyltransferase YrrM